MALFDKLLDFVSGGTCGNIVDVVARHFPPSMSNQEKEQMKLVVAQASREYELELLRIAQQEQESFNKLIKDTEGTAADLNNAGWFGRIILFFRGAQRPVWGFAVLYLDFMVFSGAWHLTNYTQPAGSASTAYATQFSSQVMGNFNLQSAFWVINFLVLGFLFGERAIRNVMPIFHAQMGGGQASAKTSSSTHDGAVG